MTKIAVLGAAGYTALELIKVLLRHPDVEIVAVTDLHEGQPHVAMIHPSLAARLDLCVEKITPAEVAARADCVFACLPHGASASIIPLLLEGDTRVVDFSADYRLNDPEVFAEWYNQKSGDPDRLGKVPYGLPELFREEIRNAPLVANPGCFPTSAILPLSPLLKAGLPPLTIPENQRRAYLQLLADYQLEVGRPDDSTGAWPNESLLADFSQFSQSCYGAIRNLVANAFGVQKKRAGILPRFV